MYIKRGFDIVFAFILLVLLTPVLILIGILIKIDSKGSILFKQLRVGKNNRDFTIFKFRSMVSDSKEQNLLTLGDNDRRITKAGYYLRKYKLDELPQLFNVFIGDMSFVGPRPELRYFVNFYSNNDLVVLKVKPGITGLASLKYRHEAELLKSANNPQEFYINSILPDKLKINKEYIENRSLWLDFKILSQTVFRVIFQ
ncbi:sugar transferase [Aestuariibaculum marinum]|uniref:Sugar transferase n=1 Tax=Aestuariibaculum marinum TaxID=2683592 RepID=A0A8J6U1D4_9FLAO|nr:sugar transferase [Aestuariibaculum marinum]MBD0822775.1 sugar transferase [Aestuariibaculum marinum]